MLSTGVCLKTEPVSAIPANLSYEEAAALPVGARTALHHLRKAGVQRGQKVLVYGASGSVGTYAVQLAAYFGAEVTGVCSTANVELVRSLGADEVIDYTIEDFSERRETYDVLFEAVDKSSFAACEKALKRGGAYVNVTQPFPSPRMLWARIARGKRLCLGESPPGTAEDLAFLSELAEAGHVRPVIDRRYTLEEVAEAHRYVETGRKKGNVVITVAG